jgi:hypothetical protein
MNEDDSAVPGAGKAIRVGGLDSVDAARLRVMALKARIDAYWPAESSGLLKRRAKDKDDDVLTRLVAALPTPLPCDLPGVPVALVRESDTDLRVPIGRAVDAALLLMEDDDLERQCPGKVNMFANLAAVDDRAWRPDAIEVADPSVGLIVGTIIGILEAIAERLMNGGARDVRR